MALATSTPALSIPAVPQPLSGQPFPAAIVSAPSTPSLAAIPPPVKLEIDWVDDALSFSYPQTVKGAQPLAHYRCQETGGGVLVSSVGGPNANLQDGGGDVTFGQTSPLNAVEPTDKAIRIAHVADNYSNVYLGPFAQGIVDSPFLNGFALEMFFYNEGVGGNVVWTSYDAAAGWTTPYLIVSGTELVLLDPSGSSRFGGYGGVATTGANLTVGAWHHVVVEFWATEGVDQGSWLIFVDGALVGDADGVTTNITDIGYIFLSYPYASTYLGVTAQFDEIALYARALAGSEIQRHYVSRLFSGPPAVEAWSDESAHLVEGTISFGFGRQQELGRVETSQLSATLRDDDRSIEPGYASGPHYPNVEPGRMLRLTTAYNGVAYPLWRGYIDTIPISEAFRYGIVDLDCVDAMGVMAAWPVTAFFPQEASGSRVNRLLDIINWPASKRQIDAGVETVAARSLSEQAVLDELQLTADSENGVFWIDGAGNAVFQDQTYRTTNARATTVQFTFSEGTPTAASPLPYVTATFGGFSRADIINQVEVSYAGGSTSYGDVTSQFRRGAIATYSRSTILVDPSRAYLQAVAIVNAYKDPKLRVTGLTLHPLRSTALWPAVLDLRVGDRVRVVRTPYATRSNPALARSIDVYVESFRHNISYGETRDWQTTISTSSV